MTVSLARAHQYIQDAEIPIERGGDVERGGDLLSASFDAAKDQATVVGADVLAFVQGVTAEGREAIVNSSLLAQMVAKKKVADRDDIEGFYRVYFDALTNLGWVIQQKDFAEFHQESQNFEAHQAVLAVATTVLGGAPTALALVTSAINSLHSMDSSRPWITIFNRESQVARTGRFQISLVSQETQGQFLVSMLAFGMKAKSTITQVLFFKAKADQVTLRHDASKVTIAADVITGALPALRTKLASHVTSYVSMAEI